MKSEQILVVDDEKRIVENISLCLKRQGFDPVCAYDGEQALELFGKQAFDLVLMDVSMPGMSGYEVMEHIFGMDENVLIILITGYASVESAIRALKMGAWDYLKKPFEYADLIKTVKNALTQRNLIREKQVVSERLEASERQYEYIVNNSPDLIFTLDNKGCFTFANQHFKKLLGIAPEELIGCHFKDLLHEGDHVKAEQLTGSECNLQAVYEGSDMNFRFKKSENLPSGYEPYDHFAFMELKASPIYSSDSDSERTFQGVYAVARDVTERVNLEEQLRQAQKMEAIGTLAGGIAHDFNNILMGIQGYASLVKAGFDRDSDEFKKLSSIDEYVYSGAEMAKQLLGFAQKTCQETSLINLNYLLKMSAKMFGRTKKDILIEHYLAKDLWATPVDEGQIKQVLLNLFVNAWQAMPNGGRILIKSENIVLDDYGMDNPGNYVKITVADTGCGIDESIVDRIFDPFFTTKERGQGTGLGLATAYGIIKSHKGMIKVESHPEQGSAFMFFLPAKVTRVKKGNNRAETRKIINGKGLILLVDDEKGVIEVCSDMLETLGYQVKTAGNGIEAIEIIKEEKTRISLVVLDMVMPKMDGRETFDHIRALEPDIKILLSSGYSREEEIAQMLEKGCDGFILKPFDVETLSEKIDEVMKQTEKVKSAI